MCRLGSDILAIDLPGFNLLGGGKLLPQTLKLPPQKFSQMQFKIMA